MLKGDDPKAVLSDVAIAMYNDHEEYYMDGIDLSFWENEEQETSGSLVVQEENTNNDDGTKE